MQIKKLSDRFSYVSGPANIGIVHLNDSNILLIDSGTSSKYAAALFELLSDYRFKVSHIFNTHSHADHIGGNCFLQEKTGCKILAAPLEAPTIAQPLVQAAVLFSGAPINDLLNKFVSAQPSKVQITYENHITIDDIKISLLDLPGHSVNQKGIAIDDIAYVADTLFSQEFFKKQRLPFNYDPIAHLHSLERLEHINAKTYLGGHIKPLKDIKSLISMNKKMTNESLDIMREILSAPQPHDRIVKTFMDKMNLKKTGWEYFLYQGTVNGYLSALHRKGEIKYRVIDNLALWYMV